MSAAVRPASNTEPDTRRESDGASNARARRVVRRASSGASSEVQIAAMANIKAVTTHECHQGGFDGRELRIFFQPVFSESDKRDTEMKKDSSGAVSGSKRKPDKDDEEPMTGEDVTGPIAVSAGGERNEVLEKQSENMRNVLKQKAPRQQRACLVYISLSSQCLASRTHTRCVSNVWNSHII